MTERRYDPLSGEWRTFATDRQDRTFLPPADACPLCPDGRGGGEHEIDRSHYEIAVFDNRFPSFQPSPPPPSVGGTELSPVAPAEGAAEMVVWSDEHRLTLTDLPVDRLSRLIEVWADRYAELSARPDIGYVLIFENKGAVVGATLDHPHGQIYGYPDIPPRVRQVLTVAGEHLARHGRCVRCDVGAQEVQQRDRIVDQDHIMMAFVPFAARFPYEVHIQPKRHATTLLDLSDVERASLARVLHRVLVAYDELFGFPLPYVLALHQAPAEDSGWLPVSHLHVEITPLHRSADKLKFLAGSELAAGSFINDVAPEASAATLARHAAAAR
jgi:UDPglucose--hexose-1-phosphate uridylyltransferase